MSSVNGEHPLQGEQGGQESGPGHNRVVNADLALQTWACPHTSRPSWQASSPWGTAAAPGTLASAALRTQVSLPPAAFPQFQAGACGREERLPGCRGESSESGFPAMAFCFSASLRPSFSLCITGISAPVLSAMQGCCEIRIK